MRKTFGALVLGVILTVFASIGFGQAISGDVVGTVFDALALVSLALPLQQRINRLALRLQPRPTPVADIVYRTCWWETTR